MEATKSILIIAPLYIDIERKTMKNKRYYINMNTYRNLHHRVNGMLKKKYLEAVREQLEGIKIETPCEIPLNRHAPLSLDFSSQGAKAETCPTRFEIS